MTKSLKTLTCGGTPHYFKDLKKLDRSISGIEVERAAHQEDRVGLAILKAGEDQYVAADFRAADGALGRHQGDFRPPPQGAFCTLDNGGSAQVLWSKESAMHAPVAASEQFLTEVKGQDVEGLPPLQRVGNTSTQELKSTPLSFSVLGPFDQLSHDHVTAADFRAGFEADQRPQIVLKVGNSVVHLAADQMDSPPLKEDATELTLQLKPQQANTLRSNGVELLANDSITGQVLYYQLPQGQLINRNQAPTVQALLVGAGLVFAAGSTLRRGLRAGLED